MTTPRPREDRAARGASRRFEAKATSTDDTLLRLFKRTLRDLTPQQRRILAGEIAVVIPSEGMMQGHPDPLWLQSLRAFARRELDLDQLPEDARPSERGGAEARALGARITETIGEMIDELGQGGQISLNKDEVARRLNYADRKGLEFAMSRCSLDWKLFQRLLRSPAKNA